MTAFKREDFDRLESTVSQTEIFSAIKSFPVHKAPGPDGYGIAYYKAFGDVLVPYMGKMFNAFLKGEHIPESFLHSHVVVRNRARTNY